MADPSNMEQLLKEIEPLVLKKYTTDRRYDYRGCICIVDCGHFMEIVDSLMAPSLQIKKSDLVVLNKIDTVSEAVRSQVIENIKKIKPDANIYCTTYSEIPENILPTSDTQNTETAVKSINTKENRPYGAVLYLEENYEYVKMVSFFQTIAAKLYRMKGFFSTANGSFYVSGVGKDVQFSKTKSVEVNSNKVVLIGTEASPELTGWISEVWEDKVGTKIVIEEDNYISD